MLRSRCNMKLDHLARELASTPADDEKSIDFSAAGLYLPGAQTILATTLSAAVSVLACWLIPIGAISAVRTLALTALSGFVIVRKPIKIGGTRGVNTVFSALRPCCLIYVGCLVMEQLVHTCVAEEARYEHGTYGSLERDQSAHTDACVHPLPVLLDSRSVALCRALSGNVPFMRAGFTRRVVFHVCVTTMTVAALMRSRNPRSESDTPFVISSVSAVVIAMLPPPALALSGPLCSPPTLVAGAERLLRAFLFSCVYVVLVYAAAPLSNQAVETFVCIARSTTASVWILGAVVYTLPVALLQLAIIIYCSFKPVHLQYANVLPSDMEIASVESSEAPFVFAGASIETRVASSPLAMSDEPDPEVAAAVRTLKAASVQRNVQPVAGNGLQFSIRLPDHGP